MQGFRKAFQAIDKEKMTWFPGHMGKGLKQMQQKLKQVDCVIEVHDCRIPFSGRNEDFKHSVSGVKPHILVLNKKDLVDRRLHSKILGKVKEGDGPEKDNVLLTNCKNQKCDGVRKVIPTAIDLIRNSDRFNRSDEKEHSIMIIGVPNIGKKSFFALSEFVVSQSPIKFAPVGKSSLINILRNRHLNKKGASAVGGVAGITRSVLTRIKISEEPLIYLLDTPGILMPNIKNVHYAMKLALCSCFQDHLVGEDNIADYLLYWLNKQKNFKYVEEMGLENPSDNISEVLVKGATKYGKTIKYKNYDNTIVLKPDLTAAAKHMLQLFRTGELGKVCLDVDLID